MPPSSNDVFLDLWKKRTFKFENRDVDLLNVP